MDSLKICSDALIDKVLTLATEVHKELGNGLLESVYEKALIFELNQNNIKAKSQVEVPVIYKGENLGIGFKADIVIEDELLLELKTVEQFSSIHLSQVINYLKLLKIKRGFLLNFHASLLKHGIKRVSI